MQYPSKLRVNNPLKVIVEQPNISSIRNKFDTLCNISKHKMDIFLVSETKIDNTFPLTQLCEEGYSTPCRHDRTGKRGVLFLYVKDNIPSKQIKWTIIENEVSEKIFVELNLRKKWLLCCSYD